MSDFKCINALNVVVQLDFRTFPRGLHFDPLRSGRLGDPLASCIRGFRILHVEKSPIVCWNVKMARSLYLRTVFFNFAFSYLSFRGVVVITSA